MATTSRRRRRVSSSRASARARPMWPWLARAAYDAVSTPSPSVRTRKSVTSSTDGVASTTSLVRDRIVGSTSSTVGAHSSHTVRSVGSSIALSSALAAWSVSRSASSTIITCQRLPTGASAELRTRSRTSSTPMESFSVRVIRDVGVRTHRDLVARVARAAPTLLALQPRGEGDRGVGAARPGRAGEQPGMRHVTGHGTLQPFDHRTLADEAVPDGARVFHGGHRRTPSSSGVTRSCTASAISSAGARASSTR